MLLEYDAMAQVRDVGCSKFDGNWMETYNVHQATTERHLTEQGHTHNCG